MYVETKENSEDRKRTRKICLVWGEPAHVRYYVDKNKHGGDEVVGVLS